MNIKKENKEFIFVEPIQKSLKSKIKSTIGWLAAYYYKFKIKNSKVKHTKKKYFLSINAIFKNEGFYLKEWIDFHLIAGIEHFYLYNNFSDDNYLEILDPYIEKGIVELIEWPVEQGQLSAYEDCITRFSSETQWLAFIDIDEFITPLNGNEIKDVLVNFIDRPVVKLYWKIYGSSDLKDRNLNNSVVQDFTYSWPKFLNFGKCIFNTDYAFDSSLRQNNAFYHHMWAKSGDIILPPVNIVDNVCLGTHEYIGSKQVPIQLNHYIIKSYNEFVIKKSRGDAFFKVNPRNEEYFKKYDELANSIDLSAIMFLESKKVKVEKE